MIFLKIEVSGQSSHVAQPQNGRDAVLAAASIVVELQKNCSSRD